MEIIIIILWFATIAAFYQLLDKIAQQLTRIAETLEANRNKP